MKEEINTTIELSGEIDIDSLSNDVMRRIRNTITDNLAKEIIDYISKKYDQKEMEKLAREIIDKRFYQEMVYAVWDVWFRDGYSNGRDKLLNNFLKSTDNTITIVLKKDIGESWKCEVEHG